MKIDEALSSYLGAAQPYTETGKTFKHFPKSTHNGKTLVAILLSS